MGKILKKIIIVESFFYNEDIRFDEAMKEFEDKEVITIALIDETNDEHGHRKGKYMVFYQEVEADSDDSQIDSGDLVYWRDVNTNVKIYETVDKVINKDGNLECHFVETEESEGGMFTYQM